MGRLGERRIGELENWMVRLDDRLRRIAGRLKRGFLNEVMEKIMLVELHVAIESE